HYLRTITLRQTLALTQIYTLSLHDALPISGRAGEGRRKRGEDFRALCGCAEGQGDRPPGAARDRGVRLGDAGCDGAGPGTGSGRSEEHTSELQSRFDLVCRLLLEKKNINET